MLSQSSPSRLFQSSARCNSALKGVCASLSNCSSLLASGPLKPVMVWCNCVARAWHSMMGAKSVRVLCAIASTRLSRLITGWRISAARRVAAWRASSARRSSSSLRRRSSSARRSASSTAWHTASTAGSSVSRSPMSSSAGMEGSDSSRADLTITPQNSSKSRRVVCNSSLSVSDKGRPVFSIASAASRNIAPSWTNWLANSL